MSRSSRYPGSLLSWSHSGLFGVSQDPALICFIVPQWFPVCKINSVFLAWHAGPFVVWRCLLSRLLSLPHSSKHTHAPLKTSELCIFLPNCAILFPTPWLHVCVSIYLSMFYLQFHFDNIPDLLRVNPFFLILFPFYVHNSLLYYFRAP